MKLRYLVVALLFLAGCQNYAKEEIVYYPFTDSIPQLKYFYKKNGQIFYLAKECRYYTNGQLKYEGFYNEQEKKSGKWTYFADNGTKVRVETFVNGKKNGKMTEWYLNGKKMFDANYKEDLPDGKWIIYDEDGKKQGILNYKNGEIVKH